MILGGFLEPGEEGRNSDAARHPDFVPGVVSRIRFKEGGREGAPGTFDRHRVARTDGRQGVGREVAQSLHGKEERAVGADRGDGKRMLFFTVGREEGEFARTHGKGLFRPHGEKRDVLVDTHVAHDRLHGLLTPGAAHEKQDRVPETDRRHGDVDPAERQEDVGRLHESDRVDGEDDEEDREELVPEKPLRVADGLHEDHGAQKKREDGRPDRGFDRKAAKLRPEEIEPGEFAPHDLGHGFKRHEGENRLHEGLRHPVHDREPERPEAERAVPAVEGVQRRLRHALEPGGARGDDDRHRHEAPGEDAVPVENLMRNAPAVHGGGLRPKSENPGRGRQRGKTPNDALHSHGSLLCALTCQRM